MAKPRTITMLELRRRAEQIVERTRRGERFVLTYRGRPVARLEPFRAEEANEQDPFYRLSELAQPGRTMTNREIDALVYGT